MGGGRQLLPQRCDIQFGATLNIFFIKVFPYQAYDLFGVYLVHLETVRLP